jgi:hypothetical protein
VSDLIHPEEGPSGITRRQALKRAAAAGTIAWITPVLQTINMSVAQARVTPVALACRMTGGGRIDGAICAEQHGHSDAFATHGFELHCDGSSPNTLTVQWCNGNTFHLDALSGISCVNDPTIQPPPPPQTQNQADTYIGSGTGTLQGPNHSGTGTISFRSRMRGSRVRGTGLPSPSQMVTATRCSSHQEC